MGFLNHATNNIIIDAVLTERGRELLARNDGSFNISSFSFGDDEVDYTVLSKYGLSIGKEKIEKNTPIFEANPNENIAIKHPLITFTNSLTSLSSIPTLKRSDTQGNTNSTISLYDTRINDNDTNSVQYSVQIKNSVPTLQGSDVLNENITDNRLYIKLNSDLISIVNNTPLDTDLNNIATYSIATSTVPGGEWSNQIVGSFTINSNGIVSASDFTKYASLSNSSVINTSIQVIGASSGATLIIPVSITRQTSV